MNNDENESKIKQKERLKLFEEILNDEANNNNNKLNNFSLIKKKDSKNKFNFLFVDNTIKFNINKKNNDNKILMKNNNDFKVEQNYLITFNPNNNTNKSINEKNDSLLKSSKVTTLASENHFTPIKKLNNLLKDSFLNYKSNSKSFKQLLQTNNSRYNNNNNYKIFDPTIEFYNCKNKIKIVKRISSNDIKKNIYKKNYSNTSSCKDIMNNNNNNTSKINFQKYFSNNNKYYRNTISLKNNKNKISNYLTEFKKFTMNNDNLNDLFKQKLNYNKLYIQHSYKYRSIMPINQFRNNSCVSLFNH